MLTFSTTMYPQTYIFYFSLNIWFLCSLNQNSTQFIQCFSPSLVQPNDISSQSKDRNNISSSHGVMKDFFEEKAV